jgi:glycosyltransferase involved in cell wall biosynthesis
LLENGVGLKNDENDKSENIQNAVFTTGDILIVTKNKKICYIQYFVDLETNIEHLSKAIAEINFDVTIITISPTDKELHEVVDGRKYYRIPLKEDKRSKKSVLFFILKIIKYLRKNDFDIVHIGHSPRYFGLIRIFSPCHAKFIYHSLSYPISSSALKAKKAMLLIYLQCLLMDKVIIQSKELMNKWIGIRNLQRTSVVPVGFNKSYFYPLNDKIKRQLRREMGLEDQKSLLVYCGVMSRSRKLDLLLEAFRNAMEITKDIKLLMIGDGDALEELKKTAATLKISEKIIFTGKIPHQEVVNYIGVGDIGISYIPINESYNYNPPLKTYEYLSCGLATIATNTESNKKIVKSGFNGILANDCPHEFGTAIVKLVKNKKMRRTIASNARKSIIKNDYKNIARVKLVPLYNNILGVCNHMK